MSAYRWAQLALYNAEVSRGLVHTDEWKAAMAVQQAEFDAWAGNNSDHIKPERTPEFSLRPPRRHNPGHPTESARGALALVTAPFSETGKFWKDGREIPF